MAKSHKFAAVKTGSGNVLSDWLGGNTRLKARMDVYLRRLKVMDGQWPMPYYYPLGGGIGEIRFDLMKVEHRLYGYFAQGEFIIVLASSNKKKQKQDIQTAKNLKASYQLSAPATETYDV